MNESIINEIEKNDLIIEENHHNLLNILNESTVKL